MRQLSVWHLLSQVLLENLKDLPGDFRSGLGNLEVILEIQCFYGWNGKSRKHNFCLEHHREKIEKVEWRMHGPRHFIRLQRGNVQKGFDKFDSSSSIAPLFCLCLPQRHFPLEYIKTFPTFIGSDSFRYTTGIIRLETCNIAFIVHIKTNCQGNFQGSTEFQSEIREVQDVNTTKNLRIRGTIAPDNPFLPKRSNLKDQKCLHPYYTGIQNLVKT
ncbi:hypothetical protein RUM44_013327 [Polyplax serrata]|uniref:Uncharacterized protein n=1 Tax=Polyplax serrata TaxID=468196 RepID=A0ABR1BHL3_POLSC